MLRTARSVGGIARLGALLAGAVEDSDIEKLVAFLATGRS